MPTARAADGASIAYDVDGSGPLLLFVHGITEARRLWDPVVERLRGDFTCARLDLRGHGDSDAPGGYDPVAGAADVTAVVESVAGPGAPVVVGHSLGGIAVTAYAAGGGPTRAVVNVDQGLRLTDFAALVRPLEAELRGPGFAALIAPMFDSLGVDRLDADTRARVREMHARARQDVVLGMWGPVLESTDEELDAAVGGLLGQVRVPYLALHGADPGPGYVEWLTERVPTATVEVWDGAGHWLHLVEPDRFAARVRRFEASVS